MEAATPNSKIEVEQAPIVVARKKKEEQLVDSNAISVSNMREYEEQFQMHLQPDSSRSSLVKGDPLSSGCAAGPIKIVNQENFS